MTEKLKVSREVADAIEYIKTLNSIEEILAHHSVDDDAWVREAKAVNILSLSELATALIVGYEVELTPHEQIATIYNHHYSKFHHVEHKAEKYFSKGYVKGIRFTLEKLGITIEGVNDNDNNS